jgi:hypothetical protein
MNSTNSKKAAKSTLNSEQKSEIARYCAIKAHCSETFQKDRTPA